MKYPIVFTDCLFYSGFAFALVLLFSCSRESKVSDGDRTEPKWRIEDSLAVVDALHKGDHHMYQYADSALFYYLEANKITSEKLSEISADSAFTVEDESKLKFLHARTLQKMGLAYSVKARYSFAVKSLFQSQLIFEELEKSAQTTVAKAALDELSVCYINLGMVHQFLQSNDIAEELIQKAIATKKTSGDTIGIASYYIEAANFYLNEAEATRSESLRSERLSKAAVFYQLTSQQSVAPAFNNVLARYYLSLAHFQMLGLQLDAAGLNLQKAEELSKIKNENYWKAHIYGRIAEWNLIMAEENQQNPDKFWQQSILNGEMAFPLASKMNDVQLQKKLSRILQRAYAATSNLKNYSQYVERYVSIRDTIVDQLKRGTLAALEQEHQNAIEKEKTERLALKAESLNRDLRNERLFTLFILITLFGLLLTLVYFFVSRKKVKSLLLQISDNEKHLKALVHSIPGTFYRCLTDEDYTMIYLGDEVFKLTGYSKDEFLSKKIAFNNLIHPDDRAMIAEKVQNAIRLKQPYVLEYRIIRNDGKIVHVFARGMAEYDIAGEPNMLNGTILDISDKIEAENELKYIYKLSDRALDLTKSGFWQIKLNDAHHFIASDRARDIFGFVRSDENEFPQLKSIIQQIAAINPDSAKIIAGQLKRVISGEEDHFEMEHEYLHPQSGEAMWIKSKAYVDKDENGNPMSLYGVSQDISITKRLQKELETAREAAEAATKAKSDFLANMSHEIRTPMNAIIGMTHLVQKTKLDEKQLDYVSKISRSANALLGIINDILDFSKIEAGKLNIENIDFELQEVLSGVTDLVLQKAHQKNLEFLIRIDPAVPAFLIGDPLRLGQVITNLCSNAVKFTEEGYIVVDVSVSHQTEKTIHLKVEVKDSGIGLNAEQQQKLFRAFSQADTSTTRKYGGTGLGLTISQNLVKLMNGSIGVESDPGKGSNFHFTIECGISKKENQSDFKAPLDLRGMKVMICDDNETAREILAEALRIFTFEVILTGSAKEAISMLQQPSEKAVELLVLDYKMPEINGLEALSLISNDPLIAHKPKVIMVSAYAKEVLELKNDYPLIDGFIEKPLNYSTLFNSIMDVFGQYARRFNRFEESNDELLHKLKQLSGNVILLVEDNEINQQVAKEIIEETGLVVEIADNGEIAVEMVRQSGNPSKYQLVLMDLQMPVMDGITATQEIRKMHDYITLPILAMTADAMAGVREKVLEAGMMDMLTKPIDPAEVYKKILKWMVRAGGIQFRKSENLKLETVEKEYVIPEIAGLETEAALQRLNGNKKLYLNVLEKFYQNNLNFIQDTKVMISAGDSETLKRQFHTLKGLSGSIGASEIQQLAQELEHMVESNQVEKLLSLLSALDEKMQLLFEEIHSKLITEKQSADHVEAKSPETLINELDELIKKKSPQAKKLLPELEQAGLNDPAFLKLKRALTSFNFKEAGIQLVEIKKNYLSS